MNDIVEQEAVLKRKLYSSVATFGAYTLQVQARSLESPDGRMDLQGASVVRILQILMQNPGRAVTFPELFEHLYNDPEVKKKKSLRVFVCNLNAQLVHTDLWIVNKRREGYMLKYRSS